MSKFTHKIRFISVSLVVLLIIGLLGVSLPMGNWRTFNVQTGSMEPAIKTGSLVFVHRVPAEQLRPGDVVTYINPNNAKETITHRLIAIKTSEMGSTQYMVQGDANQLPDPMVSKNQIVGKVQGQVPYLGKATSILHEPLGIALIIYLPALGIVIEELKRLTVYFRAQRQYKLVGYEPHHPVHHHRFMHAKVVAGVLMVSSLVMAVPTQAALQDTVTLTANSISSVTAQPPVNLTDQCTVVSSNNASVSNTTTQSASSGNANTSNNTTGGTSTSGDATNNSSTSTTIVLNNSASCP